MTLKFFQDVSTSNNGAGEFYDIMTIFDSSETPEFKTPADGSPKDVKRVEAELDNPEGADVEDTNVASELTSEFDEREANEVGEMLESSSHENNSIPKDESQNVPMNTSNCEAMVENKLLSYSPSFSSCDSD